VIFRIKRGSDIFLRVLFPRKKVRASTAVGVKPSARNGEVARNGGGKPPMLATRQARRNEPVNSQARSAAAPSPGVTGSDPGWYEAGKRAGDVVLALVLLVLNAPLLVLAVILVKLTSRGPVLYSQVRLGRGGRPFTLYKIRTMAHQCESLTGIRWSTPGDPRITPVGRFLRRTHVDELPQLWNVLCGAMSLVGPRPERPEFVPQLEHAIVRYRERLLVRPGLTGLAQVQLPPDTDLDSVRVKLAYDLYYVREVGWWLDLRILLGTALHVVGVPFRSLRRLLCLPDREVIEGAYQASLPSARGVKARVQPA
jgi:lipopolysaccharide/colanic/teichoic acid biosynthesis glycosyltransferase